MYETQNHTTNAATAHITSYRTCAAIVFFLIVFVIVPMSFSLCLVSLMKSGLPNLRLFSDSYEPGLFVLLASE